MLKYKLSDDYKRKLQRFKRILLSKKKPIIRNAFDKQF